jgi:hypothetical protein
MVPALRTRMFQIELVLSESSGTNPYAPLINSFSASVHQILPIFVLITIGGSARVAAKIELPLQFAFKRAMSPSRCHGWAP